MSLGIGIRPGREDAEAILIGTIHQQREMLQAIERLGGGDSGHGRSLLPKLVLLSQEVGRAQQDLYWALLEGRP